jgi:hypothetical protein
MPVDVCGRRASRSGRPPQAALIDRVVAFGRFDVPNRFAQGRGRLDHATLLRGNAMEGTPEIRRGSLASDALAGTTAHGGGGATRTSRPPQAKPLRSPLRHAQRPRHPLYRKESIVPNNNLKIVDGCNLCAMGLG